MRAVVPEAGEQPRRPTRCVGRMLANLGLFLCGVVACVCVGDLKSCPEVARGLRRVYSSTCMRDSMITARRHDTRSSPYTTRRAVRRRSHSQTMRVCVPQPAASRGRARRTLGTRPDTYRRAACRYPMPGDGARMRSCRADTGASAPHRSPYRPRRGQASKTRPQKSLSGLSEGRWSASRRAKRFAMGVSASPAKHGGRPLRMCENLDLHLSKS